MKVFSRLSLFLFVATLASVWCVIESPSPASSCCGASAGCSGNYGRHGKDRYRCVDNDGQGCVWRITSEVPHKSDPVIVPNSPCGKRN